MIWILFALLWSFAAKAAETKARRLVVIGDIHADIEVARGAFQLANAIDADGNWIGESLVVVQLGDLIGRSFDDREVLEFILGIQKKAEIAGGKVYALIGNHEVFGARLELRWVHENAYTAFDGIPGLAVDDPRLLHLPAGQRARGAALMPGGHFARQLSRFPAVLRLGKTIFVHGGVTPYWADYGIDQINEEVSQWFAGRIMQPLPARGMDSGNFDDSVMMSRHYSDDVDENDCAMLEQSLSILNAERMIVAHTVQDSITARCDEKVWAVDVGMSRYYGGSLQVLEIINDTQISVISR